MQIRKKFPNKGMNKETKATSKIGLVKTNLVSIRVTGSLFVIRDPNLYEIRELKPIPDLFFVLSREGTRNCPSFIGGGKRSSLRNYIVIRRG